MQLLVISTIILSILGFAANVDAIKCYEKLTSLGPQTVSVCGEGRNLCNIELDKNAFGQTRVVARGCARKNSPFDSNMYYGEGGYQPGCWKKKNARPGSPDEVTCFCESDLCNDENDQTDLNSLFADTLNNKRPLLSSASASSVAPAIPTVVIAVTPAAVPTPATPVGGPKLGGAGSKPTAQFFLAWLTACAVLAARIL